MGICKIGLIKGKTLYIIAPLLLVEATSAMDRNTENFILALLQKPKSDMGVLMVTHRIKTAQRCDGICILESGAISAKGTPGGTYAIRKFLQ